MKFTPSRSLKVLGIYGLTAGMIVGWWTVAFKQPSPLETGRSFVTPPQAHARAHFNSEGLFGVNRDTLQQALRGDFQLMGQLIAEWDIDAQLLQSRGSASIKRLPADDFIKSQWLMRQLKQRAASATPGQQPLAAMPTPSAATHRYQRFLPQTYAAASFLLALAHPEEIVALPHSLREKTQLYPRALTNRIPLDIDRYNAEKLFLAQPEIAFVAHYSNPATVQALSNQGIDLYMMKDLNTLADITDELVQIGTIVNRPLEAEMLKIFIDAAIAANDNKISMVTDHYAKRQQELPRVLFLNFHQNFSVPTQHTLTGQLLKRLDPLDISLKAAGRNGGSENMAAPMDKERLLNLNPDCLIIAAENKSALEKEMRGDAALSQLKAVQSNKLFFVDETIQHSPTQYIVLAYHDLIQVLTELP